MPKVSFVREFLIHERTEALTYGIEAYQSAQETTNRSYILGGGLGHRASQNNGLELFSKPRSFSRH